MELKNTTIIVSQSARIHWYLLIVVLILFLPVQLVTETSFLQHYSQNLILVDTSVTVQPMKFMWMACCQMRSGAKSPGRSNLLI